MHPNHIHQGSTIFNPNFVQVSLRYRNSKIIYFVVCCLGDWDNETIKLSSCCCCCYLGDWDNETIKPSSCCYCCCLGDWDNETIKPSSCCCCCCLGDWDNETIKPSSCCENVRGLYREISVLPYPRTLC